MWIIAMVGKNSWSPWYWGPDARGTWGWLGEKSSAHRYPTQDEALARAAVIIGCGEYDGVIVDAVED